MPPSQTTFAAVNEVGFPALREVGMRLASCLPWSATDIRTPELPAPQTHMDTKLLSFKLIAVSAIAFVGVWFCGIVVGAALAEVTGSGLLVEAVLTCALAVYVYGQIMKRCQLPTLWLPAQKPGLVSCFYVTTALALILALGVSVLVLWLPERRDVQWEFHALSSMLHYLYPLAPKIFVLPLIEEVFFRGVLLRLLVTRSNVWMAIIMQSALFVAVHFSMMEIGWNARTLLVFLAGCFLGVVFLATRSLLACTFLHVFWNATSFSIGALSPNESASYESLVQHYKVFMWGSVALMALLFLCSVAAFFWTGRTSEPVGNTKARAT